MLNDFHPYSTAEPYLTGSAPNWLKDNQEILRMRSYMLYEQMYWTAPQAYKVTVREEGLGSDPLFIPSGRSLIDTQHRYVGNGMNVVCDPAVGTSSDQKAALELFRQFMLRERVTSKYNSNRRYGLIRGDWVFMLTADPDREEGSRVSLISVDPGSLYPIYEIDEETGVENQDVVVGWHIIEQYQDERLGKDKAFIKRTTFRKATGTGGPSTILYSVDVFEPDDWGGPGMSEDGKLVQSIFPETSLPAPIDQLPIYVIPNFVEEPGYLWGASSMRGLEQIIAAITQGATDEDVTLAMDGLGVYATNAGVPVNQAGEEIGWNIGPGRVVELPTGSKDTFFNRVSGVANVGPYQEHLGYLGQWLDMIGATPDVAKGKVDVAVAESGIALALQMGPTIAYGEDQESIIGDRLNQLWFGWARWTMAYEGGAFKVPALLNVSFVTKFGPKIPENKQQSFDNILALITNKVIDLATGWDMLRELGYKLPENAVLLAGIQEAAEMEADAMASRINGEINQDVDETGDDDGDAG